MEIGRVGIIGFGFAGQLHAQVLRESLPVENIPILDKIPSKSDEASRIGHTVYQDLEEFLALKPDMIITAVPPSENKNLIRAIAGSRATQAVLIEKPIALNVKDALDITSYLSQAEIFSMAGLTGHFHPEFRRARELIDQGILGQVHAVIEQIHQGAPDFPPHYVSYEYGGAIKELGIHTIDHLHCLLNRDDWRVSVVRGGNDYWGDQTPDWCEVSLVTESEKQESVMAHASWAFVQDFTADLNRKNYSTVILGSRGKIIIYGFDGLELLTTDGIHEDIFHPINTNSRDRHLPGFKAEDEAFINAFIKGEPSPIPLTYACRLQEIVDQIYDQVHL